MPLHPPSLVDSMFKATAGAIVKHGGDTAYGHFEHPVDESDTFDGPGVLLAVPSVVIANCILAEIGWDLLDGARGVGEVVEITERTLDGQLGDSHEWTVSEITRVSDDGAEIRLLLTDE